MSSNRAADVTEAVLSAGDTEEPLNLSRMKKAELLSLAEEREVEADESMTKAEIIEAIGAE